jgi:dTDP-4-amino-4,6-dideoxygalactose transaminase
MTLARHAPAGRPVPRAVFAAGRRNGLSPWPGLHTELFGSGTAALGAAIKLALGVLPEGAPRRVALPAYACPNLVAATLWADGIPEYYDLAPDASGPASGVVESLSHSRDFVMLHVDAFGADTLPASVSAVPEGLVIHDLAQSFAPFLEDWRPRARFNVASFGRAKPLSLTLGGALIAALPAGSAELVDGSSPTVDVSGSKLSLRAAVYALSLHPAAFGVLSRIPALGIGRTSFTPLTHADRLPQEWQAAIAAAVAELRGSLPLITAQTADMLRLARESGARVPASALAAEGRFPLWRVPVLCPDSESATVIAREGAYLGLSRLYLRPLPQIMGMAATEVAPLWPNAAGIAARLITLPTHGRLGERRESQLRRLLESRLR